MASENKGVVWLALSWAVVLAIGSTYYLIRSWRLGVIAMPARVPRDVSRVANPYGFWFSMFFYLAVDVFALSCLAIRLYMYIRSSQ